MATPRKPSPVKGLSFKITVEPLRNGQPWPGVESREVIWNREVLAWHQNAIDTGVMIMLRDVEHKVRVATRQRARNEPSWPA